MRNLLQRHHFPWSDSLANVIDLDCWRRGTSLAFFGVELRLRRGTARVVLRQIGADGGEMPALATLDAPLPGSVFSPPIRVRETGALIRPQIVAASDDADFDLVAFTDDPVARLSTRICHVLHAADAAAAAYTIAAFAGVAGAGHMVVLLDSMEGAGALAREGVSLRPAHGAGAMGQGLYEVCHGGLSGLDPTHFCLIGRGVRVTAETFARLRDLLRFVRPGVQIGATLYDAADPGLIRAQGRAFGDGPLRPDRVLAAGIAADDLPALIAARDAVDFAADFVCLPREAVLRVGLPWPDFGAEAGREYGERLKRALDRPVMSLALRVEAAALDEPTVPATDTAALRRRLLLELREPGAAAQAGARHAARVNAALESGTPAVADALLRAMGDILDHPGLAAPATPLSEGPVRRPLKLRAELAAQVLRLETAADTLGSATVELDRRQSGFLAWRQRLAGRAQPPSLTDTGQALEEQVARLQQRILDLETRLRAVVAATEAASRRHLEAAGLADPERVRADLDRASLLALGALKGVHAGRRCVIVGNGPSLRIDDLERLAGEITFASNKIFLAYPQTGWRPTYYSVEDSLVLASSRAEIERLRDSVKIFPANLRAFGYHAADTIFIPFRPPRSFREPLSDPAFPDFSTDLLNGICWGSTIAYSQIQMAVHMGCREIFLIGMDHAYTVPARQIGNTYISDDEVNHFHPDYRRPGERWHQPNLEVLERSFARAREVCERLGIRIVNASRQSRLTVFERAEFDLVFPEATGGPNGDA